MPAKKKSCFQITSVIQAQVAGNSVTGDTERSDDPDESRTEDISSEALDLSRTELGQCDRSSSEDSLDHDEDVHNGLASVNGLLCVGTGGRNTPLSLGGSVPVLAASHPTVPTPTSQPSSLPSSGAPASCSSRFRVIKLDHGIGEPFRRGRWACTEFYEKDSDINRTMDSIKPTASHDQSMGPITNSMSVSPRAFLVSSVENTDGGHPKGLPMLFPSSESQQQAYTLAPQIGSIPSAFQPTGYATAKTQQAHENVQTVLSQTYIPNSLNGFHQGTMLQKTSTVMPTATQPQKLVYSNGMSPGQPEYYPQHFGSGTQSFPAASQPMVPSSSQPPVSTATGQGGQVLQTQSSEAALAPGVHPQTASARALTPVSQTLGRMGITVSSPITISSDTGIQSVSTTVPSSSVAQGHSSALWGQTQDTRPKSDALPLSIACVVPGKTAVKSLINEGLTLATPTVSLFGISIPVDGDDDSASGASVVAIDNKIEQAMDLVKNHLMYAVREEVEVLKEQIKELYERNSVLERENAVLKSLANSEQLSKLSNQLKQANNVALPHLQQQQLTSTNSSSALGHYEVVKRAPHQPNITTA